MGRKKSGESLVCLIPTSLMRYVSGIESSAVKDKVVHFLHILVYHINSNYPDGEYYLKKPLDNKYLKAHYTDLYYKQVVLPLKAEGIIEVNDSYSTDFGYCKEYGFTKEYRDQITEDEVSEVPITKPTLIQNIKDWRRGTLSRQIEKYPFIEQEADMLLHLNIDLDKLHYLHSQRLKRIKQSDEKKKSTVIRQHNYYHQAIVQLTEAKDLLDAQVSITSGRVYHPFVNCPREFRKAVVDEQGQPYEEVDLRSSQAVFLCKVIAVALKHGLITYEFDKLNDGLITYKRGKRITASDNLIEQIIPLLDEPINVLEEGVYPSDFTAFVSAVFLDDIYEDASPKNISQSASVQVGEDIYEVGGYTRVSGAKTLVGEARDEAKRQFFKDIFFNYYNKENYGVAGQLSISTEYLEDFAKTYYTVYEFCRICALQSKEGKKKSRDLALLLQQTESKFFHELLPSALSHIEPFNYFVVHDAVYLPQKHQEAVINACNEEAVKFFGVVPMFR